MAVAVSGQGAVLPVSLCPRPVSALSWPDSWKARSTFLARCRGNAAVQPPGCRQESQLQVTAHQPLVAAVEQVPWRLLCEQGQLQGYFSLPPAPHCSAESPCKGPASFPRSFSGTLSLKNVVNGNCCA